jgi:hypothetical protein
MFNLVMVIEIVTSSIGETKYLFRLVPNFRFCIVIRTVTSIYNGEVGGSNPSGSLMNRSSVGRALKFLFCLVLTIKYIGLNELCISNS